MKDAAAESSSPGVVFSQRLHGGEELDALLQGHRGLLLLRLQHALVLLVGLDIRNTNISRLLEPPWSVCCLGLPSPTSASCSS